MLAVVLIVFSILPYLIPLQPLTGNRNELAFENSEFTAIKEVEIHFRRWHGTEGSGDKVLLVHGFGGSTFTWRYLAPDLQREGFQVVAADLPGFGLSERQWGLDHSPEARAEYLWLLLEYLYPGEERWHLVGHSMGGATVTVMALQRPGKVRSITLAAGAIPENEPSPLTILLHYPPLNRWVRVLGPRLFFNENRVEELLASAYGRQPAEKEVTGYYLPFTIEGTDLVLADLVRSSPQPLLDQVGELDMPVLCLWGEDDAWVPRERGEKLAGLIPEARLVVIPEEGHCPMETSPVYFKEALLDFIDTAGSR